MNAAALRQRLPTGVFATALDLTVHGISGYAWRRSDIVGFLDEARRAGLAVLGGDVLELKDKPVHTCDNWFSERSAGQIWTDFVDKSHDMARTFIENYREGKRVIGYAYVLADEREYVHLEKRE